jgi:hypothetical protein
MSTPPRRPLVNPPPPDAPPPELAQLLVTFPPTLAFALSTTDDLKDDVQLDRAVDGTGRARSFYITPKHSISATLAGLYQSEWVVFDAFYRANRAVPFTIPWGDCDAPDALPVLFTSPPKRTFHGNGLSSVAFTLEEFP